MSAPVRLDVALGVLTLGQLHGLAWNLLIGDLAEQMRDAVEPRALLIISIITYRATQVSVAANIASRARVVVPAAVRLRSCGLSFHVLRPS
jgi:hypothetical protein